MNGFDTADRLETAAELLASAAHRCRAFAFSGVSDEDLARTFARVLREWLTAEEIAEVNAKNSGGEHWCASHDYCDANMAMAEAWTLAFGNEPSVQEADDCDRWDRAWTLAKRRRFFVDDAG